MPYLSRLLSRLSMPAVLGITLALPLALLALAVTANPTTASEKQGELTAGEATVFASGLNAFSFPLATLDDEERARFAVGNSFFRRNWVEAPASTRARDGLGPHFIARSCGGCHVQDGRGAPPEDKEGKEAAVGLLIRLSIAGRGAHGGVLAEPVYGDQLNNNAVSGVQPEGQVQIKHSVIQGRFADGTHYTLRKPHYQITQLAYGPLSPGTLISPRVAPQLAGVGLLEAIDATEIERNARQQAALAGPIKGQPNYVWDDFAGQMRLGRFGWKANVATLAHQTAGAFHGDMGITSTKHPAETCTPKQQDCLAAPRGGQRGDGDQGPEIDDQTLSHVVFYQSTLAPAARRNANHPTVQRGEALFQQAQCATCHRPNYVTAPAPNAQMSTPKVSGLRIWPYTDLLLHDMGEQLADHRPDFDANGRQWKTPPLWGVGLIHDVNGHRRLLHDGRADGVLEAILWHGGEAELSKQQVLKMKRSDRDALVKFVESL